MIKEEINIKEAEELGAELIDNPIETVAVAPPTKLKFQALAFMIIGKVERHFLNNMLKQSKETKTLATAGLKNVTTMSDEDKKAFLTKIDSNVAILEDKIAAFDTYYRRVIENGRHSLKIPNVNFGKLATQMVIKKYRKEAMTGMVEAYKQMNDVFSTSKKTFEGMAKPIKRDVEVSKAEQEDIKKSVYQALKGATDEKVESYAKTFDDKEDAKIDNLISKKVNGKNKEIELDNFFDNISPIKNHTKLESTELDQILNSGQVKNNTSLPLENKDLNFVLNEGKPVITVSESSSDLSKDNKEKPTLGEPIFSGKPTFTVPEGFSILSKNNKENQPLDESIFSSKPTLNVPEWLQNSSKPNEEGTFTQNTPTAENSGIDPSDTLTDDALESFARRLTGKQSSPVNSTSYTQNNTIVPNVDELSAQLAESINEIERKRQAKEEAKREYEAEKQAREQEEDELSRNREENERMKKEIERKRQEQKAVEELNQKVEKALKYQRQIEENRRAVLKEEEEAKKYKETLRIERENQSKVAKERERLQSERATLQTETKEIDYNLQEERKKLEAARTELQHLTASKDETPDPTMKLSHVEPGDINYADYLASFSTTSTEPKRQSVDTDYNGFYVNLPIQGRDEQMPKKDDVLVAITPKGVGDEKTSRRR